MNNVADNFSPDKLKAIMTEQGLTQAALAAIMYRKAGRFASPIYPTAGVINRHINGHQKPTLAYIRIYAKVLGCESKDLLNGQ
jgi:hypothetical protein